MNAGASIVVAARQYSYRVAPNLVDKSMFLINPSGPATLQVVFQRFRLAWTGKGFPLNVPDQPNDSECLRSIAFHPPGKIFEGGYIKFQASQSLGPETGRRFG